MAVNLFIGQDQFSKDIKLEKIKRELFLKELEPFNFDSFHAQELNLNKLQEVLLRLPVKARKRLVLIKEASHLKEPIKDYLTLYIKKPATTTLLILDVERLNKKDTFLNKVLKSSTTFRFREGQTIDTFSLNREINNRRINTGLKVLQRLLLDGVRPEKIMGGLRYCWENNYLSPQERKRRLGFLLNCDIDIKTGRLNPQLALERLLINLCCP